MLVTQAVLIDFRELIALTHLTKSNESSHMSAKQTKCWMSQDVKKLELFGDKRQRQM